MTKMNIERAKRAKAQTPRFTDNERAIAHFAGSSLAYKRSWGSASLHPRAGSPAGQPGWGARLYAIAAFRGLRTKTINHLFRGSFSLLIRSDSDKL